MIRLPERRLPSMWGFDKGAPPIVVRDRWGRPYTAEQWLRKVRRHQEARTRFGEEANTQMRPGGAGREREFAPVVAVEGQLF